MKALFLSIVLSLLTTTTFASVDGPGNSSQGNDDSGLSCTMSYSSTNALSNAVDSNSEWLVSGQEMAGSAVSAGKNDLPTSKPANFISVEKSGKFWTVAIMNAAKEVIGSFSFTQKQGMKATMTTKAFMTNENEDPAEYNKLEVSCHYTIFAG